MFRILLLIALLITMMSGCGGDETKPPDPPPDADESLIGSWERFGSAHVKFRFDIPENIEIDVTKDTLVFASDSHPTDDDDHELVGTWTQNISIKYTDDFSNLGNGHVGVIPPGEAVNPPGEAIDPPGGGR